MLDQTPHTVTQTGEAALPNSGKAIASLVLGIVSIPTCIVYGLPALVCGILAVIFHKQAMEQMITGQRNSNSAGMSKAGMICGYVGIGLGITYLVLLVVVIIIAQMNA